MVEHAKRWLRKLPGRAGLQIVRNRLGLDPQHDLPAILGPSTRIIFDVGANVGQSARSFAALFPSARILSFEPDPQVFETLKANVAALPNVSAYPIALGAESATRSLYVTRSSEGSSLLPLTPEVGQLARGAWAEAAGEKPVQVERLDEFAARHAIDTIDLLKSDTQGGELEVLGGAGDLLTPETIRAVFCEVNFVPLYQNQAFFDQVYQFLVGRGYRLSGLYNEVHDRSHRLMWCDALFV